MNIHRKERAKLKQAADENSPPLDIPISPSDHELQAMEEKILFQLDSNEEKSCTPKKPCSLSVEDDTKGKVSTEELQQLSLFVETSDDCASGNEVKGMQLSHALPQTAEVDLELRLGPQGTSSAVMGTREFF